MRLCNLGCFDVETVGMGPFEFKFEELCLEFEFSDGAFLFFHDRNEMGMYISKDNIMLD